jgi:hypothetical protein
MPVAFAAREYMKLETKNVSATAASERLTHSLLLMVATAVSIGPSVPMLYC